MKFYSPPYEFEAVQWKGDNLEEVRAFCGTRPTGDWDIDANKPHVIELFNPIGTYLIPSEKNEGATGEVRDVEAGVWRPVNTGDWIVQQEDGFVPCTDEWLRINKVEVTPEMEKMLAERDRPKSFEHEVSEVINRHSKENPSGTPDFILAAYLTGCLDVYNKTVVHRANWRSEPVELPALTKLIEGQDGKEVPLVIYTNGQRNEVGTAQLHVTPGEVYATGTITGVIPVFGTENISAAYSLELDEPKDEPLDALSGSESMKTVGQEIQRGLTAGTSRFDRYMREGLTKNDG